jgi:hypothetical protein
MMAA